MDEQRGAQITAQHLQEGQVSGVSGSISRWPRQVQEGEGGGRPLHAIPTLRPTWPSSSATPLLGPNQGVGAACQGLCLSVSPPAIHKVPFLLLLRLLGPSPLTPHHLLHLGPDPQLAQQCPEPPLSRPGGLPRPQAQDCIFEPASLYPRPKWLTLTALENVLQLFFSNQLSILVNFRRYWCHTMQFLHYVEYELRANGKIT